jgi:SAM-dependent methyltransferase
MGSTSSFDNFDRFATDYRQIHNQNLKLSGADSQYFSEFKVKWLHDFFGERSIKTILDLGAGDGTCLSYFSQFFPTAHLYGIDISELSIAEATQKNLKNTEVKVYDGTNIPYADNTFDLTLVATVMHHIRFDLHPPLMAEAYRTLKPGGSMVIWEHNPYNPVTRHMVNTCPFDEDAVLLSPGYSKKLLQNTGFQQVKNHFTLFFPRGGFFKKLHFIEKHLSNLPIGGQYVTIGQKPS